MALRLLGREVLRGAHDRPGQRHVRRTRPRDPEIGNARPALVVEQHVVRLEIAVNDPVPVREAGRMEDLRHDVDRQRRIKRALFAHDRLQRSAGHVLHRDVVRPLPLAAVEDGDDVRVRKRRRA